MLKCVNKSCEENTDGQYLHCKKCIERKIKICTCNKVFVSGIPEIFVIGDEYYKLPDPIPPYFFKQIKGNIYGIQGCRGCKYTNDEVLADTDKAIRMSISSCVYQKIDGIYEYMSDAIDPVCEEKLASIGISLGNPAVIEVNY
jgi:hypothetical protein